MPPTNLDFGVMCRGTKFEDWQADCIRALCSLENVNLELLIVNDRELSDRSRARRMPPKPAGYGDGTDRGRSANETAWRLYRRMFGTPACRTKTDLSDRLSQVDRMYCERTKARTGAPQRLRRDDLQKIRECGPDFILHFAFEEVGGDILTLPTYGVWSFHHGDDRTYQGAPPCFWEMHDGTPVTGAVLRRLTDCPDRRTVLKRGFFLTDPYFYSETLNNVCYGAAEWPSQVAIDLLNGNGEYVERSPTQAGGRIYGPPTPRQLLSFTLNRAYSLGAATVSGTNDWNVGVIRASLGELLTETADASASWFSPQEADGFVADPFPITIGDTQYVFVEEFPYSDRKGKISYTEYPDGFEDGRLRTAHEEQFHMSYPYLFKHHGNVYVMPEINEKQEIRLYRVRSPSDWNVETTIAHDTEALDPTIVEYDDRWWIFHTEQPYANTKLFVRYSDKLTSGWKPHANNPVKTDVRSSRPGGTPFRRHGELYRPAQDCSGEYGRKIVVNQVDTLTPTQYSETTVKEFRPPESGRYTDGIYTLSSGGEITFIDGRKKIWNGYALRQRAGEVMSTVGTS